MHRFLIPHVTRAVLLWLLIRPLLWASMPDAPLTELLNLTPLSVLVASAVTAVLAQVDARVMNEPLFYANLGIPRWTPAATAFITATAIDLALALVI